MTGTSKLKGDLRVLRGQNQVNKFKGRPMDHWASRLSVPSQFCRSLEAESLLGGGLIRKDGAEPRKGQVRVDGGEGGAFCR